MVKNSFLVELTFKSSNRKLIPKKTERKNSNKPQAPFKHKIQLRKLNETPYLISVSFPFPQKRECLFEKLGVIFVGWLCESYLVLFCVIYQVFCDILNLYLF